MADWGLVAIRFALYADLMLLVGLAAFPLYSFARSEREDGAILPLGGKLLWLVSAALPLSAAGFAISSAAMMGVPITALDVSMLASMAGDTDQGAAFLVRMAALLATLAALVLLRRTQTPRYVLAMVGGSIALATLLWSGHAAATEGALGIVHRISDIAHMIAAAIWIGGIASVCLLLAWPAQGEAHITLATRSLADFARVGTVAVAIIALTGLFNGYAIFGADITKLFQSTYYLLLAAKLVLFAAMLSLAANNRWRLAPALDRAAARGHSEGAWTRLRISVALEAAAGAAVLALVAWLGTLTPAN